MKSQFDHEKLIAYQLSIELVAWITDMLEVLPKSLAVHDQLDRASTSIPLNIAEGNGKFTSPDRCRYFDIARGSALECAAALDVLVAKKKATVAQVETGKDHLHRIVSMLVGLVRSNSPDRLHEQGASYRISGEEEK
jgi:four helix bundle protein